jgi:hypothetical protein
MKKGLIFLFSIFSLILAGCPQPPRTIEDTISRIREKNHTSRNLYVQYYYIANYYNQEEIERLIIPAYSIDTEYRWSPTLFDNPSDYVKKIIIVDKDSHKMIKKFDTISSFSSLDGIFELEKAEDDYGMRVRWEYYLLNITDELINE